MSVYGLLSAQGQTAAPVFSPGSSTFSGSVSVNITDATPAASIYYTTDGSTPTPNSTLYKGALTITSTTTINAIAIASGLGASSAVSATYTSSVQTGTPIFSPGGGTYTSTQTVTLSDATPNAKIYYTLDASVPNTSSTPYTQPLTVGTSKTIKAIATATGLSNSSVASANYVIQAASGGSTISFPSGFANSAGSVTFNGSTGLDDTRLQLTNGGQYQAGSAFYNTPVNITSFTTDFMFQLSNPAGDGMTFTIQGVGPTALGPFGGGLGYGQNQANETLSHWEKHRH